MRFIEVKGRAGVGEVALSANEKRTAERFGRDYWLYVVYNCGRTPKVHPIQDPARLGWEAVMAVEHYRIGRSRYSMPGNEQKPSWRGRTRYRRPTGRTAISSQARTGTCLPI